MFGGFGSIQGMITSLANNKKLASKHKSLFEEKKTLMKGKGVSKKTQAAMRAYSAYKKEKDRKVAQRLKRLLLIMALLFIAIVVYEILF